MARLLFIPLFILVFLAGAMFWSGTTTESPADFSFINRGEVTTLDPVRMSWLQDIRIAYAVWETLYTPDPKTLQPVPGAAVSYTLNDAHTVYTFKLRANGKWSNGDPVVAEDFVFGWRRMLENPDEYTALFHLIRGAETYQTAYAKDAAIARFDDVGIRALDPLTLRVTLERPVAYFMDLVAFTPFVPQHRGAMVAYLKAKGFQEATLNSLVQHLQPLIDKSILLSLTKLVADKNMRSQLIAQFDGDLQIALAEYLASRGKRDVEVNATWSNIVSQMADVFGPVLKSKGFNEDKSIQFFKPILDNIKHEFAVYLMENGTRRADIDRRLQRIDEGWTHPPYLIGNGPYRLDSWEFKRRLRLISNDHYWNAANTKSRVIDCVSVEDPQTQFLVYHSGGVDWLSDVVPGIAAELLAKKAPDLKVFTGFGTYFYSINCTPTLPGGKKNPFTDPRVRQAFALALDKRPIVDTVTRMGEHAATTYIPTAIFPNYVSRGGYAYDPSRARKLLADAGYPGGKGFPSVSLLFNTGAHHGDVAQIARRAWLDNLGVDVALEGVEVQVFRQRLNKKEYAIARASWIGDYADPSTFTDKYRSTSEGNDAGWLNADYDKLLEQASAELDPAKRLSLIEHAEEMLNNAAPIIPIYFYNSAYLYRSNVHGIQNDPRTMVMLQAVEVSKK